MSNNSFYIFFILVVIPFSISDFTGLLNFYSFNDGTATDLWGSNDGTIYGNPISVKNRFNIPSRYQCFKFSGSNDAIEIDNEITVTFSISTWVKTDNSNYGGPFCSNGAPILFSDVPGAGYDDWKIAIHTETPCFTDGDGSHQIYGDTDINDGEWHHIVLVREANVGNTMYLDGVLEGGSGAGSAVLNDQPNIYFAYNNRDSFYLDGYLDDTRFYSRRLDLPEVLFLRDIVWCFGYPEDHPTLVCSGHGDCENLDECDCDFGYINDNCNATTTCYGVISTDQGNVCSGHGDCLNLDICLCDEYYFGSNCNITSCGEFFSNDTSVVCSGNAVECWPYEHCYCQNTWYGNDCEVTECYGHFSNFTESVCNGNGDCISLNNCNCTGPYNDTICLVPMCWGITANTSNVCSNHGSCVSPNNCSCTDSFAGDECLSLGCWGVEWNAEDVCSGHGSCIDFDECDCLEGYEDLRCQTPICFGMRSDSEEVCTESGDCILHDTCKCTVDNTYGERCDERIVYPGEFTNLNYRKIEIEYYVSVTVFERNDRVGVYSNNNEEMFFNCSELIRNHELFLYDDSKCYFELIHFQGYSFTQNLVIEIYGENDAFTLTNEILDVFSNLTVSVIPISSVNSTAKIFIEVPEPIEGGTILGVNSVIWVVVFPVFFLIFCCCCCFCSVLICCILCGLLIQKLKFRKFEKLENVDLLLKEQEIEKDTSIAHLNINKSLFEVPFEEIKMKSILGEGGSDSIVYLASWKGQEIAFKSFKTRFICSNQDRFTEFEREVNILSSINHPASLKPPRVGILLEFCANGDLSQWIEKYPAENDGEKFPILEKIRFCKEIVLAMDYIHSRKGRDDLFFNQFLHFPVIHRDLKMENVLVSSSVSCKLMDFGLSRLVDNFSTVKTKKIGTSIYMAPEVLTNSKYDNKCDVFSFGILVWILMTEDQLPYGSAEEFVELKVASDPYFRPSIKKLEDCLTKDQLWLKDIVENCWNADPKKRFEFNKISSYFLSKSSLGNQDFDEKELNKVQKELKQKKWSSGSTGEYKKKSAKSSLSSGKGEGRTNSDGGANTKELLYYIQNLLIENEKIKRKCNLIEHRFRVFVNETEEWAETKDENSKPNFQEAKEKLI